MREAKTLSSAGMILDEHGKTFSSLERLSVDLKKLLINGKRKRLLQLLQLTPYLLVMKR